MLIALDVGNSSISAGYFTAAGLVVQKIATHPQLASQEYSLLFNRFIEENNLDKTPEGIIISSVVPGLTYVLKKALEDVTSVEPMVMGAGVDTGIKLCVSRPEEVGSDRIANAAAAFEVYKSPAAVVDFGTATTISVIDEASAFIGGAIMPGIHLMNKALASGASKLSEVPLESPGRALGIDTEKCIQSGLLYGTAGAVERLLAEIERETGLGLKVVTTGGHSELMSNFLRIEHDIRPSLTLEGLEIIFRRNRDA